MFLVIPQFGLDTLLFGFRVWISTAQFKRKETSGKEIVDVMVEMAVGGLGLRKGGWDAEGTDITGCNLMCKYPFSFFVRYSC